MDDEPTCVSIPMGNESESKWPIVPLPDTDTTFPVRLHEMLDWARTAGMSHIVSWCSHGRMFRVSDKDAFMEKVLPRFFKSTKFRSFTRQVRSIPDPGFILLKQSSIHVASANKVDNLTS